MGFFFFVGEEKLRYDDVAVDAVVGIRLRGKREEEANDAGGD